VRARIFFDDCVLLHSNPNIDFRNLSMACLQRCAVVLDILTVVVTSAQEMKDPHSKNFILPLLLYHESLLLLSQHLIQLGSVFLTINVAITPPPNLFLIVYSLWLEHVTKLVTILRQCEW